MMTAVRLPRPRFRSRNVPQPLVTLRHRNLRPNDAVLVAHPRSGSTRLALVVGQELTGRRGPSAISTKPCRTSPSNAPKTAPSQGAAGCSGRSRCGQSAIAESSTSYATRTASCGPSTDGGEWPAPSKHPSGRSCTILSQGRRAGAESWGDQVAWLGGDEQSPAGLLVRYKGALADPVDTLCRVPAYLGHDVEAAGVTRAVEGNAIASMRAREQQARIMRHQRELSLVGDGAIDWWRDELSDDLAEANVGRFAESYRLAGLDRRWP
jgi:hypothetical protein